jgi:hypothetical protein
MNNKKIKMKKYIHDCLPSPAQTHGCSESTGRESHTQTGKNENPVL